MCGSDTPSPGAGRQGPVEFDIPAGMFFEGLDYNPNHEKTMSLLDTQRRVVRHRAARKSDVHQMLDDLIRLNAAAHAADRQGNLAPHWDSVVSAVAQLSALVSKVSGQIDSAESRYEESFAAPPPVLPAGEVPPPSSAGSIPPVHLVVTPKMAFVQVPKNLSMSSKVRRTV